MSDHEKYVEAIDIAVQRAYERRLEEMRGVLSEVQHLCNKIVNSPPDTTIKGEIESLAFMLGHHPLVLNAPQKEIQ